MKKRFLKIVIGIDVYKRQELDSITGRIAKQLYPKADITIAGFETTDRKSLTPAKR